MTTDAVSGTSLYATGTTAPKPTGTDAMGSDTFLKLLVAQLKYQDPSKPADGTQFLAQTAQFQMVEKLSQLADQNSQLLAAQKTLGAIGMVGRTVSYGDGDSVTTGTVTGVKFTSAGAVLHVGTADVALADITEVSSAG
jgi:flagellar basal-body rod modification protein FlgD